MQQRLTKKKINQKRGFTILFAVLVASLILAVAVSIISIALKQLVFSGTGRESQFAYYAADTGVECALLWDFRGVDIFGLEVFATSTQSPSAFGDVDGTIEEGALCGLGSIVTDDQFSDPVAATLLRQGSSSGDYSWTVDAFSERATTTFSMVMKQDEKYFCATVRVGKWYDPVQERVRTIVDSRGYNECDRNAPARFERGLQVKY